MQVLLMLRDDRVGLLEETITVEEPVEKIKGADPAVQVVDALSQALHTGVTRIADRVVAKLVEQAAHAGR